MAVSVIVSFIRSLIKNPKVAYTFISGINDNDVKKIFFEELLPLGVAYTKFMTSEKINSVTPQSNNIQGGGFVNPITMMTKFKKINDTANKYSSLSKEDMESKIKNAFEKVKPEIEQTVKNSFDTLKPVVITFIKIEPLLKPLRAAIEESKGNVDEIKNSDLYENFINLTKEIGVDIPIDKVEEIITAVFDGLNQVNGGRKKSRPRKQSTKSKKKSKKKSSKKGSKKKSSKKGGGKKSSKKPRKKPVKKPRKKSRKK